MDVTTKKLLYSGLKTFCFFGEMNFENNQNIVSALTLTIAFPGCRQRVLRCRDAYCINFLCTIILCTLSTCSTTLQMQAAARGVFVSREAAAPLRRCLSAELRSVSHSPLRSRLPSRRSPTPSVQI